MQNEHQFTTKIKRTQKHIQSKNVIEWIVGQK